ncbi:hypothetical protein B1C78_13260 [Thioalkalivibrio denitrificans]|uniref:C-type lysozyme inhibitor domain-containing protein n=2 Tax=Thioalkalivibrio denitrificans TaxID=108003 RepID=A0A1V3NCT1_9GAMM|nr:hypothetical protein B1C78_13260 [Thioalkalivibrio denitrificans]
MYQCGDVRVEARSSNGHLRLMLPDRNLDLQWHPDRSAYIADDNSVFRPHADGAELHLAGAGPVECSVTTARSPWVVARERGVHYRAVGQEPGWVVEVDGGIAPSMRVILDYGQRTLEVSTSRVLEMPEGFEGRADQKSVRLHIFREACHDSMSGEAFDTRAELHVGGRLYSGCGRFL